MGRGTKNIYLKLAHPIARQLKSKSILPSLYLSESLPNQSVLESPLMNPLPNESLLESALMNPLPNASLRGGGGGGVGLRPNL